MLRPVFGIGALVAFAVVQMGLIGLLYAWFHPFDPFAKGVVAGVVGVVGLLALDRATDSFIERQKHLQWVRRIVRRFRLFIMLVVFALGAGGGLLAWNGWVTAYASVLAFAFASAIGVVLIGPAREARAHVMEYGPSVSMGTVAFLLVRVPSIFMLSHAAAEIQRADGSISEEWGWTTLALVGSAGLIAAWRSWGRQDKRLRVASSSARGVLKRHRAFFATRREERDLRKALAPVRRRRGIWRSLDLFIHRRLAMPLLSVGRGIGRMLAFVGTALQFAVSVIDYWLADRLAVAFGAAAHGRWLRYLVLVLYLAGAAALIVVAPMPYGLIGVAIAAVAALAIARRWAWIEYDRQRYFDVGDDRPGPKTRIRIGFNQDLGDEAIVSFLILFGLHVPLAMWQANDAFGLFAYSGQGTPGYVAWLNFLGGELAKAAPFVDWSETYGVEVCM